MPHAYRIEYVDPTIELSVPYLRNKEIEVSPQQAADVREHLNAAIESGAIITGRDWELAGALKSETVEDVDDVVLDSDGITLLDDDGKTIAAYTTGVSARRIS
jgi:hypothetical protein